MRPAIEVTQADRELFITLSNADGQMAERILCGQAFTWEVEQIARHRFAEREAVTKELTCNLSHYARQAGEAIGMLRGWVDYVDGPRGELTKDHLMCVTRGFLREVAVATPPKPGSRSSETR